MASPSRENGRRTMADMSQESGHVNDDIEDEAEIAEAESGVVNAGYEVTGFGVDFDVSGLVRRLQKGDITVPHWQRGFVWSRKMASVFIESLILGIPVPGVFLGEDPITKELYVVDGQQRLRTLRGFYEGKFPTYAGKRAFALTGVVPRLEGMVYDGLQNADRRALDNSLIHATVVRQFEPKNDDTSMYQIFKRLNSGGRAVNPHEIRRAVYQGRLMDEIERLNDNSDWRKIVGRPSLRLKDQEMILRFMAMLYKGDEYFRPMEEFLNVFVQANRNPDEIWLRGVADIFERTIHEFAKSMGGTAFRVARGRTVNAAVFDSMSFGLARRMEASGAPDEEATRQTHGLLLSNEKYLGAVTQNTSDVRSVGTRLQLAKTAFENA